MRPIWGSYSLILIFSCLEAFAGFRDDLHRIGQWCSKNFLLLNPSKTLSQISRTKHFFDKRTLLTIINAFLVVFYCSNVWANISSNDVNYIVFRTLQLEL